MEEEVESREEGAESVGEESAVGVEGADQEEPVEYFCSIGPFKPKCLQVFRNAKFFTFLLCSNCFVEGALATGTYPSSIDSYIAS